MARSNKPRDMELRIPSKHAGQDLVWKEMFEHFEAHRNRGNYCVIGHRGWRKTSFLMNLVEYAIERKANITWTTPVKDNIQNTWGDMFEKAFGSEALEKILNKTSQRLTIPNCMQIGFHSLWESTHVAGPTSPIVIVDEVGDMDSGVLDAVLLPIAKKAYVELGWSLVVLMGTPNRNGNPFNDAYTYLKKGESGTGIWKSWCIPVGAELNADGTDLIEKPNPYCHPMYNFEGLREDFLEAEDKVAWQIEWLCKFISSAGGQFQSYEKSLTSDFIQLNATTWVKRNYTPSRSTAYQTGIDLGVTNDSTVIGVMDTRTQEMVYFKRFLPLKWGNLYPVIMDVIDTYGGTVYVDTTGGGGHVPAYLAEKGYYVEGVVFNQTNKTMLLDNLSSALAAGNLKIFDIPVIKQELDIMNRKARDGGGFKISAPSGKHDDIPMMLSLMIKGVPLTQVGQVGNIERLQELIAYQQTTVNPFFANRYQNI